MKVLVDILDNQAIFGMEALKSLSFVKRAKPMTQAAVELWEDLKSAAQDVRLHNFVMTLISALTSYCFFEKKLAIRFDMEQPSDQLVLFG